MRASDTRVIFHDDAVILGAWSNLLITGIRGAARREHLAEIAKAYGAAEQIYPRGLLALTLIAHGAPVGDAKVRSESTKLLESFAGVIRQISVVIEGTGVWAATMRTVLRGMTIVARNPYGMKIHDDIQAAARSLVPPMAELTDQRPTERELLDAVQRLQQATGVGAKETRFAS